MLAALLLALAGQATPAKPPPPPPCASADHRAFDFWVGEWVVTPNGADKAIADSRIERLYGGCAIRENWMPYKGTGGGSLSSYDSSDRQWHQHWVDSSGARVVFAGGVAGSAMVLTGLWPKLIGPNQDALIRMTYSRSADGSVRQHGEQSTDHGLTWSTSFDFIYRPKPR